MAAPIVVVATITAKPGHEDDVEKVLSDVASAVHAEDGCLRYALHRKTGAPGVFVMVEKWASQEALGAHMKGAAMRQLGAGLRDHLAAAPDIATLEVVPAGDPVIGAL
ncbi:MAG TPA: putative quinol monooxygenase [Nocardia sp.]|uniref:putative quinol monooxygenase n=1 Tax=Nocardia sp. TaxID=1821 RepID=UPI002B4AC7AB|nr:putative quinol monooxygenase [Nocardia sp.]HLS76723.1 putative quinol monooxygenase [Nocardia sp.]